jgi:hypothetical protein
MDVHTNDSRAPWNAHLFQERDPSEKCDCCKKLFHEDEIVEVAYNTQLCTYCFEDAFEHKEMIECSMCKQHKYNRDGYWTDGYFTCHTCDNIEVFGID